MLTVLCVQSMKLTLTEIHYVSNDVTVSTLFSDPFITKSSFCYDSKNALLYILDYENSDTFKYDLITNVRSHVIVPNG